jgi:hypothetical protein
MIAADTALNGLLLCLAAYQLRQELLRGLKNE